MRVAFQAETVDCHNHLTLCLLTIYILGLCILVLHVVADKTILIDQTTAVSITEGIESRIMNKVDISKDCMYLGTFDAEHLVTGNTDVLVQGEVNLLDIVKQLLAKQPDGTFCTIEAGEFHHREVD